MRGDVHVLTAPKNARGHEQRGKRYAVVLQSDQLHLSTWLVAPTSTSAQASLIRPEVVVNSARTHVLTDQTSAVDPERLGPRVGHLGHHEIEQVNVALRIVLGLDD